MRSLNEKIVEQDEKLPVQLSVAQNVLHKSFFEHERSPRIYAEWLERPVMRKFCVYSWASFMLAKALLCRTWRPCLLGMFLPSWQLGPLHKRSDNSLLAAVWPSRRLGLLGTVPLGTCPNRQLQQWVCTTTGYVSLGMFPFFGQRPRIDVPLHHKWY